MPDLSFESKYSGIIAGVDEVGRGPWAGPVVAAAVILNQNNIPLGIRDSKKLNKAKRDAIYKELMLVADCAIGMASVLEIDQLNILNATKLAMNRAVTALKNKPNIVLVDGNQKFEFEAEIYPIVKGDDLSLSIAAASIIAKVTRDNLMAKLALAHPYYGWEKNVGYGTKIHQDGLKKYGITDHHRKSFKPIAVMVE